MAYLSDSEKDKITRTTALALSLCGECSAEERHELERTMRQAAARSILDTRIVSTLTQARYNANLTAAEVAKRMHVSPSKVSRIENAADANLTWGEISAYAQAIGVNISMFLDPSGETATKIKHCVLEVGQLLRHLAHLAKEANADPDIIHGIDRFHRETLFNMLIQFDSSYSSLPHIQATSPRKETPVKPKRTAIPRQLSH